jgi:hypothetical protein
MITRVLHTLSQQPGVSDHDLEGFAKAVNLMDGLCLHPQQIRRGAHCSSRIGTF